LCQASILEGFGMHNYDYMSINQIKMLILSLNMIGPGLSMEM